MEDHVQYDFVDDRMHMNKNFKKKCRKEKKNKQLFVQCLNLIYFNEPWVKHSNWCENGE